MRRGALTLAARTKTNRERLPGSPVEVVPLVTGGDIHDMVSLHQFAYRTTKEGPVKVGRRIHHDSHRFRCKFRMHPIAYESVEVVGVDPLDPVPTERYGLSETWIGRRHNLTIGDIGSVGG